MKRAVLMLALAAGACGGGPAAAEVAWSIRINGIPAACATAIAHAVEFEFLRISTGEVLTDRFDCNAGRGLTRSALVQDDYNVTVNLLCTRAGPSSSPYEVLATVTFPAFLGDSITVLPEVRFDFTEAVLAAFRATWSILDEGGNPIVCSAVPADTVTFTFVSRTTGNGGAFDFNCDQGLGVFASSSLFLVQGETYDTVVTLWYHRERPDQQIVGTQAFVVVAAAAVFDFPSIVFAPAVTQLQTPPEH